jgi:hypothetical protein
VSTVVELRRCPHCDAAIPDGSQWCTQCWADLRAPADPEEPRSSEPISSEPVSTEPVNTVLASGEPTRAPGWPCVTCGTVNDYGNSICAACGSAFLAPLHGEDASSLSRWLSRFSKSVRIAGALGACVVVLLLVALVVYIST